MSRAHSFALTSLLALAACADAATAPPPTPETRAPAEAADDPSGITRTSLGALGFTESAVDVNAEGVVVGGCVDRTGNVSTGANADANSRDGTAAPAIGPALVAGQRALRWSSTDGVRDLGTLGGDASCAAAVNEAGQVVGYSRTAAGETRAFVWTAAGGMRDLGTIAGDTESRALDVNARGEIVGWSGANGRPRAVRWAADGRIEPVDVSPAPGLSRATAINDSGWVVGFFSPSPVARPAFGEQYQFLTTPAGGGRLLRGNFIGLSFANAINNRGVVVGGENRAGTNAPTVVNDLTGTPPLPAGCAGTLGALTNVNNAGVASQSCSGGAFETRAFVNVPGEASARRLPSPLLGDHADARPRSAFAYALNDGGQVVGQLGIDGRGGEATLWSVPGLPAPSGQPAPIPTPAISRLRADPAVGPYQVSAKACGGRFTVCLRFVVAEGVAPYRVTIDWGTRPPAAGGGPDIVSYTIPSPGVSLLAPRDYTTPSGFPNGQAGVTVTVEDARGARSTQLILLQLAP